MLRKQNAGLPHEARGRAELYYLSHARKYRNDGVEQTVEKWRMDLQERGIPRFARNDGLSIDSYMVNKCAPVIPNRVCGMRNLSFFSPVRE
jgi:hypothetical protein